MKDHLQPIASRFTRVLCCLAILAGAWAGSALAAAPAGELILTRGMVKLRHDQQDRIIGTAGQRVAVFVGDHVQTARGTQVQIVLRDGREAISVYSSTAFRILDESAGQTVLGLMVGKAAFAVGHGADPLRFSVRTPMASMAVHGTRFIAVHSGAQTALLTEEGAVAFSSRAYPDVEVTVTEGQASRVVAREPPTEPVQTTVDIQVRIVREEGADTLMAMNFGAPTVLPSPTPGGPPGGGPPGAGSPGGGPPGGGPPGAGSPGGGPPGGGPPGGGPPGGGPPGGGHPGGGPPGGGPAHGGPT